MLNEPLENWETIILNRGGERVVCAVESARLEERKQSVIIMRGGC